jgi:hypothetical protein
LAPSSGGSPIAEYNVQIRHTDGLTFSQELSQCDGSQADIVSNSQCVIDSHVLNAAPFNIPWGDSVYAKLSAINAYGESSFSPEGNGGTIITKADPPRSFIEDMTQRTLNSIGFSWF